MSVLIDDRQGLWLGLSSSGILRAVPPGKYMEYYINEEVAHEEGRMIRSLCPYDGRHLLVGTMEEHLPVRHGPQKLPDIPLRIQSPLLYRHQKRPARCILVQHPARTIQNTGQQGRAGRPDAAAGPPVRNGPFQPSPFPMAASWFVWI